MPLRSRNNAFFVTQFEQFGAYLLATFTKNGLFKKLNAHSLKKTWESPKMYTYYWEFPQINPVFGRKCKEDFRIPKGFLFLFLFLVFSSSSSSSFLFFLYKK